MRKVDELSSRELHLPQIQPFLQTCTIDLVGTSRNGRLYGVQYTLQKERFVGSIATVIGKHNPG